MMKTAGMFLELGRVRQPAQQESIRDNVATTPLPDADKVVSYLRSGHVLIDFMDIRDDVFDNSQQILGGPTTLTDGDWLWRDDLAYYLQRHNVTLPADFLELIRRRDYTVPEVDEPTLEEITHTAVRLMS
jgi:hypothetical protein